MKERIQKLLANAGVASRRNIEEMVRQGRIAVNGRTLTELPILVDPATDKIDVDGERVRFKSPETEKRYYFLLNKPKGVYSTNVAQGEQRRAIDLLPPDIRARLYPVGRLDADSRGLLLLTNDGELTNRLTHPRYGVPKLYRAVVDGYVTAESVAEMERGVWLADKRGHGVKTGRAHIRIAHRGRQQSVIELTIREGRNREVRRILAKMGHKVRDLTRIRIGPLELRGLAPGQFRPLTPREIKDLRKSTERPTPRKPDRPQSPQKSPRAAKKRVDSADDD